MRTTALISHVVRGLKTVELENDWFWLTVLPEVGAKIYDLVWKPTGRNYLWHNPRIAPRSYPLDANFDNYWCGGWDDAFPTCDECDVRGDHYPNLGELRSVEWETPFVGEDNGNGVVEMTSFGPITPVQAKKRVILRKEIPVIQVHYELLNIGPMPFDFIWGTHPAMDTSESAVLRIPAKTGIVDQASDRRLGSTGQHYRWPYLPVQGETTDMSQTQGIKEGIFCRHFATELQEDWFAVEDGDATSGFLLSFPHDVCTCLQLWLVYGGWRGYRNVIVEPFTSLHINLAEAIRNRTARSLAPGKKFEIDIFATIYQKPQTYIDAANVIAQFREHK